MRLLLKAQATGIELCLYGDIGSKWEVTLKDVKAALDKAPTAPVKVRINSDGGDVIEGLGIYHALKTHKGHVTTIVEACAASMASVIYMAGDTRIMHEGAQVMIHNPYTPRASGDAATLERIATALREQEEILADIYSTRCGLDKAAVIKAMAEETWIHSGAAIARGFCDQVIPAARETQTETAALRLERFLKAPQTLINAVARAKGKTSMDPKLFLEALGLAPESTEEQVLEAIKALRAASTKAAEPATPPPAPAAEEELEAAVARLHPKVQAEIFGLRTKARTADSLTLRVTALEAANSATEVDSIIRSNTDKIPPTLEAWARKQSPATLQEYLAHASPAGAPAIPPSPPGVKPVAIVAEGLDIIAKACGVDPKKLQAFKDKKAGNV